jgi:hypothetical protein
MSKILKVLKTAFLEPKFRKVFTETAKGAQGTNAWTDDNFRVDRGVLPGQRVLQVNKQTEVTALVDWVRKQGKKGTHAELANFHVDEKAEAEVTDDDVDKLFEEVARQVKNNV